MTTGLLLVLTNAVDGREAELDRWYDDTHVPDVLAVPGVMSAQRYRIADVAQPEVEGIEAPAPPAHRFLAVYELDRDPNEVMADFVTRVTDGSMHLHEALDMGTVGLSVWEPHGERRTRG